MAMTDQTAVNWILGAFFGITATTTYTPGTGGPAAKTITPPFHLRLDTTAGTNTSAATEMTTEYGYTAGGSSLGSAFAGTVASGAFTNANAVSWSVTGTWPTINGIEVWDNSGTAIRYLTSSITAITGPVNGDTVQFAAGSISVSAANW
jgi:hypothetical protein